jgi:hypothetical protein
MGTRSASCLLALGLSLWGMPCKALQREVLQGEIEAALAGRPSKEKSRALAQRLLDMVA